MRHCLESGTGVKEMPLTFHRWRKMILSMGAVQLDLAEADPGGQSGQLRPPFQYVVT